MASTTHYTTPSTQPTATTLPIRTTSSALSVRIDEPSTTTPSPVRKSTTVAESHTTPTTTSTPTATSSVHKLRRRDSLDRREALLKGKEGSRQRRRWENDRLLSNPHAVPPLPSDWEVRPTYPVRSVPYYLAPLWDAAEFQRAVDMKLRGRRGSKSVHNYKKGHNRDNGAGNVNGMSPMEEAATNVPKEVRAKLKRSRAAKGLLRDLEEGVRGFVGRWKEREIKMREGVVVVGSEDEDDEVVFVGRQGKSGKEGDSLGAGEEEKGKSAQEGRGEDQEMVAEEMMVFEGLDGDRGASFARWLVHCVGSYYGLRTWSVTREMAEGNRREAYVGVDTRARGFMERGEVVGREIELPRPLWGMV